MTQGPDLSVLASAVADGHAVDWDDAERSARTAVESSAVRAMRLLSQVRDAAVAGPDDPTTTVLTPVAGPGPRWGRYLLKQRIGDGSYGVVYRAFDSDLERDVAIKLLHTWIDEAHELRTRVRAEGQALARVRHPNVVTVFGVEEHLGQLGLCMEFVGGQTLDVRVRKDGTLNGEEAALTGREVCRALGAVHVAGLVHRDVKARNVMREQAGRIVLMDFGAGLRADHSGAAPLVGTPHYMAPELFEGAAASRLTDIYSVGVLLYFLVTGRYPVEGATTQDIRAAHRAGRRVALRDRRADLPAGFVRAVEAALAPAAARVPDAGALADALEASDTRQRWRVAAALAAAAVAVAVISGIVTTFTFDAVVAQAAAFSQDTWMTRLVMGARSMVFPAVVMATFLLPRAAWNVVRAAVARRRPTRDRASTSGGGDPAMLPQVLVVAGFAAFAAVVWQFGPLLLAFLPNATTNLSNGELATFAPLDPANRGLRLGYRISIAGMLLLLGIGWSHVLGGERHHRHATPLWVRIAGVSGLGLLVLLLQAPYKVMAHNALPVVLVDGLRCSVVGERDGDVRVFCPRLDVPRVRTIPRASITPCGYEDSVFNLAGRDACSAP